MEISIYKWWTASVLFLGCLVLDVATQPLTDDFSDLRGPYCVNIGCCPGRKDECSLPILGTLCYCDEFCNHTRVEDCCPDFWGHCLGIELTTLPPLRPTPRAPPEQLLMCMHQGRNIRPGDKFKDNCNECMCSVVGNRADILCEKNPCLVDGTIIETVNIEPQYGWTASNYTEFWGRTLADGVLLRLGTLQPERVLKMNAVRRIYDPNALPRNYDAMNEWPRYISPIQDQGWCGSSWALSTAAVASDRYGIISKGFEEVELSAQNLLSCDLKKQQSCNGGHLDRAWAFIRRYGIVDENCFPYQGQKVPCTVRPRGTLESGGCSLPKYGERKARYRVGPAYRLGNETDIMYEITKSGPVQATMKVYQDFFAYTRGIYRHTDLSIGQQTGYLSVRIIGWGEEYTLGGVQKYWKVANTWGRNWGENGYFRILRGSNECEIEAYVVAAWPEVDRKVLILQTRQEANEV